MPDDDFQLAMGRLREEFRQQLPERLELARRQLAACEADPGTAELLEQLYRTVHSLSGASGTFGLAELGIGARSLELDIAALRDRADRGATDFTPLRQGLQELHGLARSAPR